MSTPSLPIPWPENAEIKVYSGGCHCKKVRYEFEHPDIYTMPVINCNCSICEDRGYLNVFTHDNKFKFTAGADEVTTYKFGSNNVHHRFCRVCGTTIGPVVPVKGMVVVNTRTIDDIDLKLLQLRPVDNRTSRGPPSA
ncbi:Mss4-like protein [Mycena maculata]|uniref:Mss4-like protein n=1 Tax=Mycena maculata TaxID=230809 RepID=A0AAD7J736_9AGAR|nr:Mss4-like protein [Mycena maculata]